MSRPQDESIERDVLIRRNQINPSALMRQVTARALQAIKARVILARARGLHAARPTRQCGGCHRVGEAILVMMDSLCCCIIATDTHSHSSAKLCGGRVAHFSDFILLENAVITLPVSR